MPFIATRQVTTIADALNAWLPCPYTRQALLQWVETYIISWKYTRQVLCVTSNDAAQWMLRENYREWVEVFDEYRLG